MKKKYLIFDAYGTLLDFNSPLKKYFELEPNHIEKEKWIEVNKLWREKQISYTWLSNITNIYDDFFTITKNSLQYALESEGLKLDAKTVERLLNFYFEIDTFPEVKEILSNLKKEKYEVAILSNGTNEMLNKAIKNAEIANYIDHIISVDDIKIYKPDPKVYKFACQKLNCSIKEILFLSSNSWDIYGALNYGFQTVWINRNLSIFDKLPKKPINVVSNLKNISNFL